MSTDYTTGTPWLDCDLDGTVTEATPTSLKDLEPKSQFLHLCLLNCILFISTS